MPYPLLMELKKIKNEKEKNRKELVSSRTHRATSINKVSLV